MIPTILPVSWAVLWLGVSAAGAPAAAATAAARAPAPTVLTLAEALSRAEKNLPEFARSAERRVKAEMLWKRAVAAFQPKLALSASLTIAPPIESAVGSLRSATGEAGSLSVTMSLFDARAFPAATAAKRTRDAEKLLADRDEAEARIVVARAYYGALAIAELVAVAHRAYESAKLHLDLAEARFGAGDAVRTDVTRARIELVKALADITRLETQDQAARELVAFLAGVDGEVALARPGEPPAPAALAPDAPLGDLEAAARAARPDLHAAAKTVEAARALKSAAWWALAPTLALSATASVTSDPSIFRPSPDYSLVLTVAWTLYDGGTRYADLEERRAALEVAEVLARSATDRVGLEVRGAARDLETARAVAASVAEEVTLARETLTLAEARFKGGLATGLEVVDASQALNDAEASRVREELNVQLLGLELLRALGDDLARLGRAAD